MAIAGMNNETSRYNIDQANARQDSVNRTNLVNGIINNNDIPPEVRARLLREMGEDDLADAIFIAGGNDDNPYGAGGPSGGTTPPPPQGVIDQNANGGGG